MTEQERISAGGIAVNFTANDDETASCSLSSPPGEPPRRLRRRLLAESNTPLSAETIDSQLREPDLHRQDYFWRVLARHWRRFVKLKKTTVSLAKAYLSFDINEESVKSVSFEQLALCIKSNTTLKTVRALAHRLESRLEISHAVRDRCSSPPNIDHLLRLLTFHSAGNSSSTIDRGAKSTTSADGTQKAVILSRYPVRVVLCAYMITGHPNAVFSEQGECENTLAESAVNFIRGFELLVKIITCGPFRAPGEENEKTFISQLEAYDKAWCSYLHHFVAWKLKDAKLLEDDLIRASCQLEVCMMQTSKLALGDDGGFTDNMEAIKKQVLDQQTLLKGKLEHISGSAGLDRLECALNEIRSKFIEGKESESSSKSSIAQASVSDQFGLLKESSIPTDLGAKGCQDLSSRLHSSDHFLSEKETGSSTLGSAAINNQKFDQMSISENELLANEIIHGRHHGFTDSLDSMNIEKNADKEKVREIMEKAFWDGVAESIKQDKPNFSWVVKLMKEVRGDLCEMSPHNWRENIFETIDVDTLSQVLESGTLNMDCLRKILEFALVTLEKLSAPANDQVMKSSHSKLLRELEQSSKAGDKSSSSFSFLVIKGLRFVLQEIQALKREISKARIKFVEPLIKGSAGLEYLGNAFANRYGPPADAPSSLVLTRRWLSSVHAFSEQEWNEYRDSLSLFASDTRSSQVLPTTLRTGGTTPAISKIESPVAGFNQPECNGERINILVRLGLLKLVTGVAGLTVDALPETLKLNLFRLRTIQSQLQKVIVVSTCMLVLRQMLVTEKLVTNHLSLDNIVSECTDKLSELLDRVEDAGISEITAAVSKTIEHGDHVTDIDKFQAKQNMMERMLGKSLQAEDAIFAHVSRCVYVALRGAVFGGTGQKGRQLVVSALQRIGAVVLADEVTEAAAALIVMANVSCSVHGAWYRELLENV